MTPVEAGRWDALVLVLLVDLREAIGFSSLAVLAGGLVLAVGAGGWLLRRQLRRVRSR